MVKHLLTLFILLNSICVYAQKYQPMDSNMVWRDWVTLKNTNCACDPGCNMEVANMSFQIHGYVINNGITWLKLYKSQTRSYMGCQNACTCTNHNFFNFTDQFQGYLWDDTITKKVYYTTTLTANFTPTTANILYDFFNKNVGDTLSWTAISFSGPVQWPANWHSFEILNIDSMLFAGNYHKIYTVKNNTIFPTYSISVVEGIGSFKGAFSSIFTDFETGSRLVCASKGLYAITPTNPFLYSTVAAGCGTINTVPEVELPKLLIHPNPTSTQLSIENIQYENLMVVDIFGKVVLEQNCYSPKISVQHLPTGLYFLRLRSGSMISKSKFIKE